MTVRHRTNPIPHRWCEDRPELSPAHDAWEEQRYDDAMPMLVGMPCTYRVGSDSYAGVVTNAAAGVIWAAFGGCGLEGGVETAFAIRAGAWRPRGKLETVTYLAVGMAIEFRDPQF